MTELDYGRRTLAPTVFGRTHFRVDLRVVVVNAIVVLLCLVLMIYGLVSGDAGVPLSEVLATVTGGGDALSQLVVLEWRMPRLTAAVILGAGLAVSGALFQSLTRNPLGSPDVIGFHTGAYSGAVIVMLVLGTTAFSAIATGSMLGGFATAVLVYLLARRRGQTLGFRLIIVGIGVTALLSSLNTYLLLRATPEDGLQVSLWGAGSLNAVTWLYVAPGGVLVLVAILVSLALSGKLSILEMGDDSARNLGIRAETLRVVTIVVGVGLTAICTAVAGPIGFIALAAPQIARRLTGAYGLGLTSAALCGSLLLLASDLIAQQLVGVSPIPVGVVTVCLGGGYFVWLLVREGRERL